MLLPLAALVFKTASLTWPEFFAILTDERAVASYRLTFGAALLAGDVHVARVIDRDVEAAIDSSAGPGMARDPCLVHLSVSGQGECEEGEAGERTRGNCKDASMHGGLVESRIFGGWEKI